MTLRVLCARSAPSECGDAVTALKAAEPPMSIDAASGGFPKRRLRSAHSKAFGASSQHSSVFGFKLPRAGLSSP
jgi:hypothetical protein